MILLTDFLWFDDEHNQKLCVVNTALTGRAHPERMKNVPESRSISFLGSVLSSPVSVSVTGVLAVGAMAHVFRVVLYLDGDAVETELGVEKISGLLQHRLSVSTFLWWEAENKTVSLFTR